MTESGYVNDRNHTTPRVMSDDMNAARRIDSRDKLIDVLEAEVGRLRAIIRVNGLRWGHSHAEIDAILNVATKGY